MLKQDLHIHTTFSTSDNSVVPEQTVSLVASIKHAKVVGISDHFETLANGQFDRYMKEVRQAGLKLGVEVDGHRWSEEAADYPVDYYIIHCRDHTADYRCLDRMLSTAKPVIIAHPNFLETNLNKVPPECLIEINNRYVWRTDWRKYYSPFTKRFKFVIGSDAHQPSWLGQSVAHFVAAQLGVEEFLLF